MKKTACKDCGLVIEIESFDSTHQYSCPRCKSVFYRPGESFDLVLMMALSAFLFFIPTLFLPILTLTIMGQSHSVTLLEAVLFFFHDGYYVIAIIASSVDDLCKVSGISITLAKEIKKYYINHDK